MNVVLYGSGRRCEILIHLLRYTDIRISKVFDSDSKKWGCDITGHKIESPERLVDYINDYVCVTYYSSLVEEPIWGMLEEMGFGRNKIISFHELLLIIYKRIIDIKYKIIAKKRPKNIFDGSWNMELGGVESWLNTIVPVLNESKNMNVYLATESQSSDIKPEYLIDFCLYDTPRFSVDYIQRCIVFLIGQLPCAIVFSRVDELLLAAALVKEKYPTALRIVMADHGSCNGMYKDILSYRKYIDYYVCVSSGIKNMLIKYGVEPKKVEMMTCPVWHEDSMARTYSDNVSEPLRIGYAGRLEIFEKRIDVLQKVIWELEYRKLNYILSIAGTGSQYDGLRMFVEENDLGTRVRLVGQLPKSSMSDFWKNQDIALNTSDNEGRPLSNMEAMVNGAVPVVTCTVGILDDVHDGINGFVVPLNDAKLMAEKISYLGEHRGLLRQFGELARKEVIEKIDLNGHAAQWKKILEEIW